MTAAWRVDVLAVGETRWATNAVRLESPEAGLAYARDLYSRWTMARKMRVVPDSTPLDEVYVAGAEHPDWADPPGRVPDTRETFTAPSGADRWTYTREGQTATLGCDGLSVSDPDGTVVLSLAGPLPADVVASTVVQLLLAGWTAEGACTS